jgi:protein TonB
VIPANAPMFLMAGAPEVSSDEGASASAALDVIPSQPQEQQLPLPPVEMPAVSEPFSDSPTVQPLQMPPPLASELTAGPIRTTQPPAEESETVIIGLGPQTFSDPGRGMYRPPVRHEQSAASDAERASTQVAPAPVPRNYSPPTVARIRGNRGIGNGLDGRGIPIPDYPADARRRREQGVVELDLEILPDGSVGTVNVISDPGFPALVRAAVSAAKAASFNPASEDGERITGHIIVPFRFMLD